MTHSSDLAKVSRINFDLPFMINLPDGSYEITMDCITANVILFRKQINKSAGIPDGIKLPSNSYVSGDRWGKFQFTNMTIEFHHQIYVKVHILLPDYLVTKSTQIVNRMLDVCRGIKGDHYPRIVETDIFSYSMDYLDINDKVQQYTFNLMNNNIVSTGGIERPPLKQLNDIKTVLRENHQLPLFQDLLFNAYDDLFYGDYKVSVVEANSAFEVFIDHFITTGYRKNGKSKDDIENILKAGFNNLLKDHIKILTGHKFVDSELYYEWKKAAYDLRNEIIHDGRNVSQDKAGNAINKISEVIKFLMFLKPL